MRQNVDATRGGLLPPSPLPFQSNNPTQETRPSCRVSRVGALTGDTRRVITPLPPSPSILHQPNTRNATFMSRFLCWRPPWLLSPTEDAKHACMGVFFVFSGSKSPSQMRNATSLQHGVAFLVSVLSPPLPLYPNMRNATPSRHGVAFLVSVLSSLPEHPKHAL